MTDNNYCGILDSLPPSQQYVIFKSHWTYLVNMTDIIWTLSVDFFKITCSSLKPNSLKINSVSYTGLTNLISLCWFFIITFSLIKYQCLKLNSGSCPGLTTQLDDGSFLFPIVTRLAGESPINKHNDVICHRKYRHDGDYLLWAVQAVSVELIHNFTVYHRISILYG